MKRRMRGPWHRAVRAGGAAKRVSGRSVEELEAELLASLDGGFRVAAEQAGAWLNCGPGCRDCCRGPFPVTRPDARRLLDGWKKLRARDRAGAEAVRRRACDVAAALREGFPGDFAEGRLVADADALDRLFGRHASLACPVLDPASGRCLLYEARPVACRIYGPPLVFGGEPAPPCPLCFQGADRETVVACRWEPDPGGLEEVLLARAGVAPGDEWETLIALVIARA